MNRPLRRVLMTGVVSAVACTSIATAKPGAPTAQLVSLLPPISSQPAWYDTLNFDVQSGSPAEMALAFVTARQELIGAGEFTVASTEQDHLGFEHVRLNQTYHGLPVFGAQVVTHMLNGHLTVMHGTGVPVTELARTAHQAKITEAQAIEVARASAGFQGGRDEQINAHLNYVGGNGAPVSLAYNVSLQSLAENYTVQVHALTGRVLFQLSNIETGTGTGVLGDTKQINTTKSGSTFYLQDLTKSMYNATTGNGQIRTYTANNHAMLPGSLMTDADNIWQSSGQRAAVDAHFYAGQVFDFYRTNYGRNSWDNAGATIRSTVHYGTKYNNAFWNGSQMVYGDGDGVTFIALSGGLDVVAHELSHAVTQTTSNLTYAYQSGALNESFSDVMGTAIEFAVQPAKADWLIGEDVYTPKTAGDALRSMACPPANGDPQDMAHYVTTSSDNGGVHTNSGIPNKAFYLVATGGNGASCAGRISSDGAPGAGVTAAAAIWYRANTVYATSNTNFAGFRVATLQAATDLYGATSPAHVAVKAAWDWVGVH